jgi:cyclophilin family peptidyl-prolyl cis-trans isomerase
MAGGPLVRHPAAAGCRPAHERPFIELATAATTTATFHRVVPNFVVQGGSPGANEYVRPHLYTRDERGPCQPPARHGGLSTRGRDTGDMQFFVNLVDNPRLDYEYTVFGRVAEADMAYVERIAEGDVIRTIRVKPPKK